MAEPRAYTADADVDALLAILLPGIREALGEQFVGMYLHGSLAMGGFDPASSDVDYLVATRTALDAAARERLARLHAGIAASDLVWARNVEGSYIPLAALRRHDPADAEHPVLRSDGSFGIDGHGAEWVIQRYVVREYGVVLAGPSSRTLIDPISREALRQAARQTLREWWLPQLTDTRNLQDGHYQAYAVLTMCRARYTVVHGDVVPKPQAARWCQSTLGAPWEALITRALAWRQGDTFEALDETLTFVRLTLQDLDLLPRGVDDDAVAGPERVT